MCVACDGTTGLTLLLHLEDDVGVQDSGAGRGGGLGAKERPLGKTEEAQLPDLPLPLTSWVTLHKSLTTSWPQVPTHPTHWGSML